MNILIQQFKIEHTKHIAATEQEKIEGSDLVSRAVIQTMGAQPETEQELILNPGNATCHYRHGKATQ